MPLMILGGLVLLLVLAYWDMFALTSAAWSEGLYSHGWIVPLCALWLMWLRWEPFGEVPAHERWIGLALVVVGLAARLVAAEYGIAPVDRLSFLPAIFGVFMMVGGFHIIRWAGPALGFLVFMFPLPNAAGGDSSRPSAAVGQYLQHVRFANAGCVRISPGQLD